MKSYHYFERLKKVMVIGHNMRLIHVTTKVEKFRKTLDILRDTRTIPKLFDLLTFEITKMHHRVLS